MKIAMVTPYDLAAPGGVNRYAMDIAAWVRGRGHEVQLIGPASARDGTPPQATIIGRPRGVRGGGTVAPIALDPRLGSQVRRLLLRERYDVVHVHEPLMPMLSLQFLRQADAPLLGSFHSAEPAAARLYRLTGPLLRRWTRRLAARTAVSETARAIAGPALGGPCAIVPGCTDLSRFAAPAPPPELPALDGRARRVILFVGRAEARKGLDDLIDAYGQLRARHDDLRLVVVGAAGRRGDALRARVEAAGWQDVHFAGPVPASDLPRYYQAAHVFVAPATGGEAFGLVLTEAMAAGAPVVAGDNPGYRAVVRDGRDGLLAPPHDPAALAATIERLLGDEPLRRRLIAAGRERARDFDVATMGARFLSLYEALSRGPLDGPAGGPMHGPLYDDDAGAGRAATGERTMARTSLPEQPSQPRVVS